VVLYGGAAVELSTYKNVDVARRIRTGKGFLDED
jgi:hypothetical protein